MRVTSSPQFQDKGTYKEPVPSTDNVRVPRLEIDDATTYIDQDVSTNLTLTDAVTGTKTLAQLVAAEGTVGTSGIPVANDIARFTGVSTIEGRSYAEAKADLSLNLVENTTHSTDAHTMAIDGRDVSVDGAKLDGIDAGAKVGDVVGPATSTDNEIARQHSTTGKILQTYTSNPPTISDTGDVNIDGDLDVENIVVSGNVDGKDVSGLATAAEAVTAAKADADISDAITKKHTQSHDHSAAGDGQTLTPSTLNIPSSVTPAQTVEGQAVWDSDGDFLTVGDGTSRKSLMNVGDAPTAHAASHVAGDLIQSATAAQVGLATAAQITKLDGIAAGANAYVHPNHSGEVTSVADGAQTIAAGAVTLAKMANMATASLIGRNTAEAGVPEVLSKATALSLLNVADGANAYTHPNHSGEVTSAADGAQTIAAAAVTLAKMANMATASLIYRKTAEAGVPEVNTLATLKTDLGLTGTNSGDNAGVTAVTGTSPVASSGGTTPAISMPAATNAAAGHATAAQITAIEANTAKVTNATHTGEVTGSGALTIANKVTMTATAPITVSGTPTVIAAGAVAIAIPAATNLAAGHATAAQITKLDGIAAGADVTGSNAPQAHHASHEIGGGDPLRWTAAKLLLGAGAGADPTEVDLPGGASIASGTYTGNATDNRQITTGFVCQAVFIQERGLSTPTTWVVLNPTGSDCIQIPVNANPNDMVKPYLHATDGFTLGSEATTANLNAIVYAYIAFG